MTVHLYKCDGCGAEADITAEHVGFMSLWCNRCRGVFRRVYQVGVGRVDGAGGSPGRSS